MRILIGAALAVVLAASASAQTNVAPNERVQRGAQTLENVPATPPAIRERLRQYVNTRTAGFQDAYC